METDALIVGPYRYWLVRRWDSRPGMTWVMLNPSTADATVDDPTIRKCVGFAKEHGCGAVHVVNLFAYRARDVGARCLGLTKDGEPKHPLMPGYDTPLIPYDPA